MSLTVFLAKGYSGARNGSSSVPKSILGCVLTHHQSSCVAGKDACPT
jgi:hypothetical protein